MTRVPPVNELRKICQLPERMSREDWWSRYVGRPISIYITKLLLYTPITGNQLTILMLIAGVAAGTLFIFGNYWYSIAGALLHLAEEVLDCVDGEVARFRKTSSLLGRYLDLLTHDIVYPYIFVGISFGVYANSQDIRAFIFGFLASLFTLLLGLIYNNKSRILREAGEEAETNSIVAVIVDQASKSDTRLTRLLKQAGGKVQDPTSPHIIMHVILIGAIFNWLHIILIIYGILIPCRWLLEVTFDLKYTFRGR